MLSSVVQYFPDMDYLLNVLDGILNHALAPDGTIFIGDVRSLPLLEAFHASVQLYKAGASDSAAEIALRVRKNIAKEKELAIDPSFFFAIKTHFPQIRHVNVVPKCGLDENELTDFRYDVFIYTGGQTVSASELDWKDWCIDFTDPGTIERRLFDNTDTLALRRVPNARVTAALTAARRLQGIGDTDMTTAEISKEAHNAYTHVSTELLSRLGEKHGYQVDFSLDVKRNDGSYDAVFRKKGAGKLPVLAWDPAIPPESRDQYANAPLQEKFRQTLTQQLRENLAAQLPEYMVPGTFAVLDALPLTANGKLDRQALPVPEDSGIAAGYVHPTTPEEILLCDLVADLLGRHESEWPTTSSTSVATASVRSG